jgi:hypothetical protein
MANDNICIFAAVQPPIGSNYSFLSLPTKECYTELFPPP